MKIFNRLKKHIANDKGFTLVELIVVLCVMAIAMGLGGFAILKWQDWATFKQENEYAQTLFVAAQNQLTEYVASGRLETLQKELGEEQIGGDRTTYDYGTKNDSGLVLRVFDTDINMRNEMGEAYTEMNLWPEAYDENGNPKAAKEKYIEDIVAIRAEAGQYEEYTNDPQGFMSSNPQAYWVFELLSAYVYDKSILNNAAISIEFTPGDGQVFAVLYSDKNSSFIYSGHENLTETRGVSNVENREEGYRNERMVGFYGVNALTKASFEGAKVQLGAPMLYNEATLNLHIPVLSGNISTLQYTVSVLDKDNNQMFEVVIPATPWENSDNFQRIKAFVAGEECYFLAKAMVENGNNTVMLVLDAADIQASEDTYKASLTEAAGGANKDTFKNTYSIFRFLDNYEQCKGDIHCAVKASGGGYMEASAPSESNAEHICFKTGQIYSADNSYMEFSLFEPRHFNNIRYVEVLSNRAVTAKNRFLLNNDVNCSYFFENSGAMSATSDDKIDTYITADSNLAIPIKNYYFPAFGELRAQDVFVADSNYSLIALNMSAHASAVLSWNNSPVTNGFVNFITNLDLKKDEMGLFRENKGKISNIDIKNSVFALGGVGDSEKFWTNSMGAFCGVNKGTIELCELNNVDVKGAKNVGGIAGINNNILRACGFTNNNINKQIFGLENVGCIAGKNTKSIYCSTENENRSISLAPNIGGELCVGGIVGYNDAGATIKDYSVKYGTVNGESGSCFVGGFVGLNASADLLQDNRGKAIDIVSNPSKVYGGYYVGGCIGGNIINTNGVVASGPSEPSGPSNPETGGVTIDVPIAHGHGISNDSTHTIWVTLGFTNNSGFDFEDWYVDFSYLKKYGNFQLYDNSNSYIEDGSYIARPVRNTSWAQKVPNNSSISKSSIRIVTTDRDTMLAIYNDLNSNGFKVVGITNNSAMMDSIVPMGIDESMLALTGPVILRTGNGMPDSGLLWAELVLDTNNGSNYAQYKIVVHNDSNLDIKDWRVEFLVDSDIQLNVYGATIWREGDKYCAGYTNNWPQTLQKHSSISIYAQVHANLGKEGLDDFINLISGDFLVNETVVDSFNGGAGNKNNAQSIKASFSNNNYRGQLSGTAFVGGFIGYNMLVDSTDADYVETVSKKYVEATQEVDLKSKYIAVDSIANEKASKVEMHINEDKLMVVKNNVGSVVADICVGGVIGYNDSQTGLVIYNTQNASYVKANMSIDNEEEQKIDDEYRTTNYNNEIVGKDFYKYSYVGGIIGKVNTMTTIDNCSNNASAIVSGLGTYTGGLAEINDGTIINCTVLNFGDGMTDYIGGLCGLNELNGHVLDCKCKNQSVSGRNVVGIIAAENYGEIKNIELVTPKMIVYGKYASDGIKDGVAGIFAGYNGSTGKIRLDVDLTNINVKSSGRFVGGITGINAGTIINGKALTIDEEYKNKSDSEKEAAEPKKYLKVTGIVDGDRAVGGFIGANNNLDATTPISYLVNEALVTASRGDAGGIVGMNNSANTIMKCQNNAIVNATNSGNAGGITSFNRGTITECQNYKTVLSPKGMCGGIVAVNESLKSEKYPDLGLIEKCSVESKDSNETVIFTSSYAVGGIAAQNGGVIKNNSLVKVKVTNPNDVEGTDIGIIVGENLQGGRIYLPLVQSVVDCYAVAESNACNIGGIAGTNKGIITSLKHVEDSNNVESAIINHSIALNGKATYGNMGGVAGRNICVGVDSGLISYCAVDASIKGNLGSDDTGYGGIAGCSGSNDSVETARISYCSFDGFLNAVGSAGSLARVGGISGINGKNSIIEYCVIGQREADLAKVADSHGLNGRYTLIVAGENAYKNYIDYDRTASIATSPDTKANVYIGGYVGENFGTVLGGNNYTSADGSEEVHIIGFLGDTGGIVGHNRKGAVVTGSKPDGITTVDKFTTDNKMTDENGQIIKPQYEVYDPYNKILATGEKWYVDQLAVENDHGPGGIIGYNESINPISYVDNHADVTAQFVGNSHTGGMIGHSDTGDISILKLSYCTNYGDVFSYRHAGGFLGESRMHSTSIENCINFGNVTTETGCLSGFIGYVHTPGNHFSFNNCINHGQVSSKPGTSASNDIYAGGFIGYVVYAKNLDFNFYNCVNTGIVKSARANAGHFIGNVNGNNCSGTKSNFELCRNYNNYSYELNNITTPDSDGYYPSRRFVGSGSSPYIYNCFDNSNVIQKVGADYPFKDGTGNAMNNYYLDMNSPHSPADYVKEGDFGVYFNLVQGNNNNLTAVNGKGYNTVKDSRVFLQKPFESLYMYCSDGTNKYKPQFDFEVDYKSGSNGISAFTVFLGNSNKGYTDGRSERNYKLKAIYYYWNSDGSWKSAETEYVERTVPNVNYAYERVDLANPLPGEKPFKIRVYFEQGSAVSLHGFGYIPEGESEPYRCNYLAEKNDVYITWSFLGKINADDTVSSINPSYKYSSTNYGTYCGYLSDYLAQDYLMSSNSSSDYNCIWLTGNKPGYEFTFKVDNSTQMTDIDQFIFYLTNKYDQTDCNEYKCEYSVLFTDVNGRSEYYRDLEGNERIKGSGKANTPENRANNRQVVSKPEELGYIKEIKLFIYPTSRVRISDSKDIDVKDVCLQGFAWVPKNSDEEQKMAPGSMGEFSDYLLNPKPATLAYTRLCVDEASGTDGKCYVSHPLDSSRGFYMDYNTNTPNLSVTYSDHNLFNESLTDGRKSDSRIDVYYDIDPKIVSFIYSSNVSYTKLAAVTNLKVESSEGCYKFIWDRRNEAAAYELYYDVEDIDGNISTSEHITVGLSQNYYNLVPDPTWTKVTMHVKAVSAYNLVYGDDVYDSPYSEVSIDSVKKVLPVPEVHMETVFEDYKNGVAKTNKLIAVLDNYEDYLVTDPVTGESKPLDCTISVYYYNANTDFSFDISEGRYYSEVLSLAEFTGDAELRCYAKPNSSIDDTYIRSAMIQKFGRGSGNALFTSDRYMDAYFNGFYGDDVNDMKYEVYYKIGKDVQKDAYMRTDISSFDKKIGLNVVYSYQISHIAKAINAGEVIATVSLTNLPNEWFGEDFADDILVRSYPHRSQSEMVYFGHDVEIDEATIAALNVGTVIAVDEEGLKLTFKGTEAEIKEALRTINDNKYYDVELGDFSAHPVMDGDDLNIGYSLVLNDDGTYTLYYNSLIESAIYQANDNKDDDFPEFKRFNVAYRHYTNLNSDDYSSPSWFEVNDYQEKMYSNGYSIYPKDNGLKYDPNYRINKFANLSINDYMQELQPTPILDGDIFANYDKSGKIVSLSVKWDKYFMDKNNWLADKKYYKSAADDYVDLANTWDAYASRIHYSQLKLDYKIVALINYYYMYAGSGAKYSIELVGYNNSGQSFVLSKSSVDANDSAYLIDLGETNVGSGLNEYTHKYDIPVASDWNYAKYTVRIIRLGENASALYELSPERDKEFNLNNSSQKGQARLGYVLRSGDLGTFRLPRYIESDINLKLPFDTMGQPNMKIHMIDDGNGGVIADSSKLSYDLKFAQLSETDQLSDLGGYLITLKYKIPEGVVPDPSAVKPNTYYYISLKDDSGNDIINLDNTGVKAKAIKLVENTDKELNAGEFKIGADGVSSLIELKGKYDEGDELLVSIKAIAKIDAEKYRDGADGEETTIAVYSRLDTPHVENIGYETSDTSMVKDNGVEVWKTGETHKLTITYEDGKASSEKQYDKYDDVVMSFAIAVYDNPTFKDDSHPDGIDKADKSMMDSGDDKWRQGADYVIYNKSNPAQASFVNGVCSISITDSTILENYAGMWIKVAVQATSASTIDSLWSDEDLADESVNYMWIHLPELEIEDTTTIDNPITTENRSYSFTVVPGDASTDHSAVVTQQAIVVKPDSNADKYIIKFTRFDGDDDDTNNPIIEVLLNKSGDDWYLGAVEDSIKIVSDSMVEISALDASDVKINIDLGGETNYELPIKSYIKLVDLASESALEIVLPDVLGYSLDGATVDNVDEFFIKQIEAIPGLSDDNHRHKEYKEKTDYIIWKRETPAGYSLDGGDGDPTPTPTPVPDGDPTPIPTPVPDGDPTPTPTPIPDGDPTPTPTPMPDGDPIPTPIP